MPPTYAQARENSDHSYAVHGFGVDVALDASKVNKLLTEE
jgi:hypothetical protein